MNDNILHIEDIKLAYVRNILNKRGEQQDERFYIIDDLDLMVPRGKITALIGGNGAGKTTLFNIISGFVHPESGKIIYHGNSKPVKIIGKKPYKITRLGIGRMFQDNHIFPEMSVLENMLIADNNGFGETPFISLFWNGKNDRVENKRKAETKKIFIDLFGKDNPFWEKRHHPANSLSYGQQRLLGLARLFMGEYNLALLDEPTAGVNPQIIKQAMAIIRRMVKEKGMTVFLIEHNMKVVLDVADFCSFMSHGKITAFGTPDDVIGNDKVRKTYLGI